jgi:pyruvate kinase
VDFVALSFVRDASDIDDLRKLLESKGSHASIVAKIETKQALDHLEEIISKADAIMVARGDLAVEISAEEVPLAQKRIINLCNRAGKPVITATQMLESMIRASTPTRAEVSDIANAVLDGTDAIMLSEETALGSFPVEAVEVMARTARRVENDYLHIKLLRGKHRTDGIHDITDSITASAIETANAIKSRYIIALTMRGFTARMLCRHKPSQEILAFCPDARVCRKLSISFGCRPVLIKHITRISVVQELAQKILVKSKLAKKGERIVVVSGLPVGESIETNTLMVEEL